MIDWQHYSMNLTLAKVNAFDCMRWAYTARGTANTARNTTAK